VRHEAHFVSGLEGDNSPWAACNWHQGVDLAVMTCLCGEAQRLPADGGPAGPPFLASSRRNLLFRSERVTLHTPYFRFVGYIEMIVQRIIKPLKSNSFFLFGARGVGKTTFLKAYFEHDSVHRFDLLVPELEDKFQINPSLFLYEVLALKGKVDWVVVDEVQKCPQLLNLVHKLIVEENIRFALTGSSARRLKQKGVNLLAGRAFSESLFPFTAVELGDRFNLNEALHFGTLPECWNMDSQDAKSKYLRSYALNYLQLEIQAEQWVRNLQPFRKFLAVAGQCSGKILNFANIARDVGVSAPTIHSYFEILEDTHLGFFLPAYHVSLRKQQRSSPKFYLFDLGVKRALERSLDSKLAKGTSSYGEIFEHFIVLEFKRLISYFRPDATLSYLLTKDGAEIDLILSEPGKAETLIEIKSKDLVDDRDTRHLEHFKAEFRSSSGQARLFLLSQDPVEKWIGEVKAMFWKEGILEILEFLPKT
jgi:uncharacterized protein